MENSRANEQIVVDNTAINSLTVTIVSVSIVSVALVGALIYLLVFLVHRRRVASPFRHRRMQEAANNMEFANRMFLQDDDGEDSVVLPSTDRKSVV